jgi:opacity protein-like surface antigen
MKNFFILSILLVSAVSALAQDSFTAMHYDVSFGLGKTSEFIGKPSFRGVGFDYRRMVNANIGVGISFGFHNFYEEKDLATYTFDDGVTSLSGIQFRYLNAVPLHLAADYYFGGEGEGMRPFIGLGVGTLYSEHKTTMGIWSVTDDAWQFSLQPEAGILYGFDGGANLFIAGKFNTPFKTSDLESYPYVSVNVGFAWMLH